MKLETERLILRELRMDDLDELYAILSDKESMLHYPETFSLTKSKKWIEWNRENYKRHGFGLWAVVLKESKQFIGDCGITLQEIEGSMVPEIGFHINKAYCKRGYATEAALACRDYAFNVLGFSTLYSYMKYTNKASCRVAEKTGMKYIKEYEDPVNTITKVYAITKDDYMVLKTK